QNKGPNMDKSTRKTSFKQWKLPINQTLFNEQVKKYQLDYYTKKLYMDSFVSLLLYAQLHETESLRALSDAVFSDDLQQDTRIDSISFSQLGRRLNQVPTSFFQTIFLDLDSKFHEKTNFQTGRKVTTPLKSIDSSIILINVTHHKWAEFRKTIDFVILHLRLVFMERGLSYPEQAMSTNAIKLDRIQLEVMNDDKS